MNISEATTPDTSARTLSSMDAFRPLVVGAPRSGFALLTSVVTHLMPLTSGRWSVADEVFNALVEGVDEVIAEAIVREFSAHGITADLLYNRNFRALTGGPKWLREDDPQQACFRKYIGVRGMGDFTLVTSHPRQVLDSDEVVHSHTNPGLWLQHPGYTGYTKFASIRNPVGILNSSVFSLNALASEYIQKFVPPDCDNDLMRQRLALYKLTDLAFVRGLVEFLVGYLHDFVKHWRGYHLMRWEDLILTPVATIMRLARRAGIPVREEQAKRIWSVLDHVNLTGHHHHNYRVGKGIVGNWREWLVNEHLELFEQMGLEPFMRELGYGTMPRLRESDYTPFQCKVRDFIRRGEICRETEDTDLFTFAFNKSNIASEAFPFRRYPWRRWTQIERSIFSSEELERDIWDVAETRTGQVNAFFADFQTVRDGSVEEMRSALRTIEKRHSDIYALAPARMETALSKANRILERAAASAAHASGGTVATRFHAEPRLVDVVSSYNVVAYREKYYGIPKNLGEFRLDNQTAQHPDVIGGASLAAVNTEILVRCGERDAVRPSSSIIGPTLIFVDAIPEAISAVCRQRLDEGCRRVLLMPFNECARRVYQSIRADVAAAGGQLLVQKESTAVHDCPDDVQPATLNDADLVLVCETEEPQVSDSLLSLVDVNARVVAVKTDRFWAQQPLFLISIPKSGTHLLYRLAEAMGYRAAVQLQDDPAPGYWYCVEYTNSHTTARDFFVDTVRRSPFGNRHHPFMRSPAIFIYRNPLDILASEAQYYHRDGKAAFAGYFSGLGPEERLLRLIDDPWLLGTARDRIGAFLPWLGLPNVVPVSFEELVGPRGGGDAEQQRRVIWSIQLKLHVPGAPDTYASQVFDPQSPTFDTGQIGRSREVFTDEAYRRFRALPQDFMQQYGYDDGSTCGSGTMSSRAEEFRHRRLQLSSATADIPFAVQYGYLGFNIVRYGDSYVAVPQGEQIDVRIADLAMLQAEGRIAVAPTAEGARRGAEALAIRSHVSMSRSVGPGTLADPPKTSHGSVGGQPRLVRENYRGFNIVAFRGRFFGAARDRGDIDLCGSDIDSLVAEDKLLASDSQLQLERLIDERFEAAARAFEVTIGKLNDQLAGKDAALKRMQEQLEGSIEAAGLRERDLRERIAQLLAAVADSELEAVEMQAWIRNLQEQLVGAEKRRRFRLPWQ